MWAAGCLRQGYVKSFTDGDVFFSSLRRLPIQINRRARGGCGSAVTLTLRFL